MKKEKGITLIALVITIIVLLILAGVSINMLTGQNGILTRAIEAKEKTEVAVSREKVVLEVMESYGTDGRIDIGKLNENLGKVGGLTSGLPISLLPADVTVDGYELEIEQDGSVHQITDNVAAIGEINFKSLQAAIDAVPTDNTQTTVRLLRNTKEYVVVDANKNIILDLNGKILYNGTGELEENKKGNIYNLGVIEIKNGTIKSNASSTIKNGTGGTALLTENLNLIIVETESYGTVENRENATMIIDGAYLYNEKINVVVNVKDAEMIIRGDTIIESDSTIGVAVGNQGNMTIEGGKIYASYANAVWNLESGNMTIKGGVMKNGDYSEDIPTVANRGEMIIENGEFISMNASAFYNTGIATIKNGIFTSNNEGIYNDESGNIEIEGNVIVDVNLVAFYNYGTTTITGGTYKSETSVTLVNYGTATVTGGTFTSNTNAINNHKDATLTLGGNAILEGYTKKYPTLYNSGNVTVNGGNVTNTASGSSIYNNNGTVSITGGIQTPPYAGT